MSNPINAVMDTERNLKYESPFGEPEVKFADRFISRPAPDLLQEVDAPKSAAVGKVAAKGKTTEDLESLRRAIDADRKRLCDALGLKADGKRYFCPKCQNDGAKHATGDLSIEAGFKCHKCGWSGDGFGLVQEVKHCDFPESLAFVRDVYGMATETPQKRAVDAPKAKTVHRILKDAARAAAWKAQQSKGVGYLVTRTDIYKNAEVAEVAAVFRLDAANGSAKEYCPVRRVEGGWQLGDPPGLWPLFRLPEVLSNSFPVIVCEGEKAACAGAGIGLNSTTSAHGSKSPDKTDWTPLHGRDVVILPDNDDAGRGYAEAVARLCHKAGAACVKIVALPGLPPKGDMVEFIEAGGTAADVLRLAGEAAHVKTEATKEADEKHATATATDKPEVLLPGGGRSISSTGRALGELLAKTGRFFIRGGSVVKLVRDSDGFQQLDDVKPAALASDFESVASLCKPGKPEKDGTPTTEPTTCPEQAARLIAAASDFVEAMPPIRVLTRCPVLIERGGRLFQVAGYDRDSGILADAKPVLEMSVDDARRLLFEIFGGFKFATQADRARAMAATITPALVFGGLLRCRAPVDLAEADASQTGKGFKNKLTAALYNQSIKTVTQQKGGVGSMEESFNMALIRGANFIALDNVRGKIDSPSLESFLTEDNYPARVPFRAPVEIDPRRVVVMMTSNKADLTSDFANRCSCVRLLKQAEGYTFRRYPEGDVLDHVRANQPRFLGAVFSIIRAWYEAGRPMTNETRHSFRPWAPSLDWITRNLLDAGPLLDGHQETQTRMANPVLNWLRDVALEVTRAKQSGAWLRTGDLVDLLADTGTETPGLPENGDLTDPETRKAAQQATGRKLGVCFRAGGTISIDGMTIDRREGYDQGNHCTTREYRFSNAAMETPSIAAPIAASPLEGSGAKPYTPPESPENPFLRL